MSNRFNPNYVRILEPNEDQESGMIFALRMLALIIVVPVLLAFGIAYAVTLAISHTVSAIRTYLDNRNRI